MNSKVSFILSLLCVVACVHLAISLPMRFHVDAGRYPRDASTEEGGSNATAGINSTACCNATSPLDCYDGDAHNVCLECLQDVANSTEQLRDRGSLDQGLKTLKNYSAGLYNITERQCSIPVDHKSLLSSFDASTPLTKANQHLANWAGVLKAHADHIGTIIEMNLTLSDEGLEKAVTLYRIVTGVLTDFKKVLQPFCSCSNSTTECAGISIPQFVPVEITYCKNHVANAGYQMFNSLRYVTEAWNYWVLWHRINSSDFPTNVSENDWNSTYLACNATL